MDSKGWRLFDFDAGKAQSKSPDLQRNGIPTEKSRKLSSLTSQRKPMSSFNFHERLKPKSVKDLAVHPKKIQEVENWLKLNVLGSHKTKDSKYLVLSGPTGCGKFTTINLVCKEMGIAVSEWANPVDQDYEYRGQGQLDLFREFLVESKWGSLFQSENYNITIVKDFPNVLIQKPELFFEVLEDCSYKVEKPIVFICTEASSHKINLVRSLFPEDILAKYNIKHISFNSCATSLMKMAIKRAQALVSENADLLKQPSSSTIDAILVSGLGDIRNTMNQFYIASLLGSKEVPTVSVDISTTSNKRKKTTKENKLKSMQRDDKLGLFHGLGRVLFPKRKDVGESWRLLYNVEELVQEFFIQPSMFTSFLFENYLKYFGDINDAANAAQILSFSAVLLENWDKEESLMFGLWISVLGVMINNNHKVSKWNQITAPKKINKENSRHKADHTIKPTDCFYYNLINKKIKQNLKSNYLSYDL